jgi:hypothetical protein
VARNNQTQLTRKGVLTTPPRAPAGTQLTPLSTQPQIALALLPNITVDPLPTSMFEVTNDAHLSIYIASLGRSVVALHDLLQNKRRFKDVEREGDRVAAEKEKAAAGTEKK